MEQRLQKLIAAAGLTSRRMAEDWIARGRVTVDGIPAVLGQSADPDRESVCVDGIPLPRVREHTYILLHKPMGYVTTCRDEHGRRTVLDLLEGVEARVFPVGRLDLNSEGLLLLTDDGDLANRLMHPSHGVEKTYLVTVEGAPLDGAMLKRLRGELILDDGGRVRAVQVIPRGQRQLEITINEGKNRQIRRMCQAVGLRVLRLCRIREGNLRLGKLPCGAWRRLTMAEVAALQLECG